MPVEHHLTPGTAAWASLSRAQASCGACDAQDICPGQAQQADFHSFVAATEDIKDISQYLKLHWTSLFRLLNLNLTVAASQLNNFTISISV